MAADISASIKDWSATAGSNSPTGGTLIGTNLDDNLRALQAAMRADSATRGTVASASTTDIGALDAGSLDVTGTTTITGLGTVSAGVRKLLTFAGVLTLTHNATSLKLPTSANIATAAGDTALFESLGSGNWNCLVYHRKTGAPLVTTTSAALSAVTAALASNSASHGDFQINWDWQLSSAASYGLKIGESAASTKASSYLFSVVTASNSTASPIYATWVTSGLAGEFGFTPTGEVRMIPPQRNSASASNVVITGGKPGTVTAAGGDVLITSGPGGATSGASGAVTIASGAATAGNGGALALTAAAGVGAGNTGGLVNITAGAAAGGVVYGSDVTLTPGAGASGTYKGKIALSGVLAFTATAGAPTISSGAGSGATIIGSNNVFYIVTGTGAAASIVVNFSKTMGSTPGYPVAVAQCNDTAITYIYALANNTSITITMSGAIGASKLVQVILFPVTATND